MPQRNGNTNGNGNGNGNGSIRLVKEQENTEQLVDFNEAREKKMTEKKRKAERILFQNLLGVYTVSTGSQIYPVEMVDVSEEGCAFQIPFDGRNAMSLDTEEVPLRLYFSQDTYMEIRVKITNSRPCIENGRRYIRYGGAVDQSLSSYFCFVQFVRFLKSYSEHAHRDLGDVSVFYL